MPVRRTTRRASRATTRNAPLVAKRFKPNVTVTIRETTPGGVTIERRVKY